MTVFAGYGPIDLSIILCTYNRAESLSRMLGTLAAARVPEALTCELVLVDNNSADGTRRVVEDRRRDFAYPVRYLFENRQGKSYALNAGVSVSSGEILAFTDDDVEIDEGWIENLVRPFAEEDVLAVGGRILPVWTSPRPDWFLTEGPDRLMTVLVSFDLGDEAMDVDTPPFGANMAIRKSAFSRYGHFRQDLGPNPGNLVRGEDTELMGRLLAAGERIVYAPDAVVRHPVDPERTTKEYFRSWYYDYGRAEVKRHGIPPDARRWLGVPRYLIRALAGHAVRWLTRVDGRARFAANLQMHRTLGQIEESRGAGST